MERGLQEEPVECGVSITSPKSISYSQLKSLLDQMLKVTNILQGPAHAKMYGPRINNCRGLKVKYTEMGPESQ